MPEQFDLIVLGAGSAARDGAGKAAREHGARVALVESTPAGRRRRTSSQPSSRTP